jgi:pantothenate kinase
VPFSELERRLIQRWLDHGHTEDAARQRALSNDIPNAELVVSSSRDANYIVTTA